MKKVITVVRKICLPDSEKSPYRVTVKSSYHPHLGHCQGDCQILYECKTKSCKNKKALRVYILITGILLAAVNHKLYRDGISGYYFYNRELGHPFLYTGMKARVRKEI